MHPSNNNLVLLGYSQNMHKQWKGKGAENQGKEIWKTGLASGSDFCREVSPTVLLFLADRLTELQEGKSARKNKGSRERRRNSRGSGVLGLLLVNNSNPRSSSVLLRKGRKHRWVPDTPLHWYQMNKWKTDDRLNAPILGKEYKVCIQGRVHSKEANGVLQIPVDITAVCHWVVTGAISLFPLTSGVDLYIFEKKKKKF